MTVKRIDRVITLAILAGFLSSCGSGGRNSDGDDSTPGFLDLSNNRNTFGGSNCAEQFAIQPTNGGSTIFQNVAGCESSTVSLPAGTYTVKVSSPAGACSESNGVQQTVSINENERSGLTVGCGACTACP